MTCNGLDLDDRVVEKIIEVLSKKPRSFNELHCIIGGNRNKLHKTLNLLVDRGIIEKRGRGRITEYSLKYAYTVFQQLCKSLIESFRKLRNHLIGSIRNVTNEDLPTLMLISLCYSYGIILFLASIKILHSIQIVPKDIAERVILNTINEFCNISLFESSDEIPQKSEEKIKEIIIRTYLIPILPPDVIPGECKQCFEDFLKETRNNINKKLDIIREKIRLDVNEERKLRSVLYWIELANFPISRGCIGCSAWKNPQ